MGYEGRDSGSLLQILVSRGGSRPRVHRVVTRPVTRDVFPPDVDSDWTLTSVVDSTYMTYSTTYIPKSTSSTRPGHKLDFYPLYCPFHNQFSVSCFDSVYVYRFLPSSPISFSTVCRRRSGNYVLNLTRC